MNTKLKMPALLIAAALSGCASGGGNRGSDGLEAVLCVVTIIYCFKLAPDAQTSESGGYSESAAASLARSQGRSGRPPSFISWAALPRDGMSETSNNLIGDAQYEISAEGAVRVQQFETSDGKYGEVQYDSAGKAVHFAAGNYRSRDGRTLTDLRPLGQAWADIGYSAGRDGNAQTPFTSRAAGEIELAANPYALGWNYQSFGVWDSTAYAGGPRRFGGTSFGSVTPASAVPTTGSATFVGKLGGMYVSPAGQGALATADIRVDANFSSRSLSFASTGTSVTRDLATAVAAPNLNLGGTLTYSPASNSFTGSLANAGGTMSGSSTGRYYGPAAQELGGVFTVKSSTTAETFAGAYGAKR